MENSLSVEDESGGEDGDRRQLRSEVIEENGLMTGKDSWRSRGDDHECGNDAWLMMDTGCNSAHQVSLTLNQGGEPLLDWKPRSPPLKWASKAGVTGKFADLGKSGYSGPISLI